MTVPYFFGVTAIRFLKLKTGHVCGYLDMPTGILQTLVTLSTSSHICHGATERLELGAFLLLHKSLFLIICMKLLPPVMYFLSEKLKLPDQSLL